MNREEMIQKYYDLGGRKEDVQHLSPDKIEIELSEQQKLHDSFMEDKKHYTEVMQDKSYKNLCKEYNIEYDDQRNNWYSVSSAVTMAKFRNKMKDSITNFKAPQEIDEEINTADARFRLEKLRAMPETQELDNFEHHNCIINLENCIKRAYGLPETPLVLTDDDLNTILMLDNWEVGKNVQSYLESVENLALKDAYRSRIDQIVGLRNLNLRREKDEKEALFRIESEFSKLSKVPKKLIYKDGIPEVNKDYTQWREDIKKFHRSLTYKQKGYEGSKKEVPEEFNRIFGDVQELIKKCKITLEVHPLGTITNSGFRSI